MTSPAEASRRGTLGLASAGGVIEGAIYEIGALCALDEAVEGATLHDLDVYVGVSSGALVSGLLASGVPARTLSRAVVSESPDTSLNLEPEVLFRPAVREYAGRLQRIPKALFSSLRYYLSNPGDLSLLGLLATFGSLVPTGLFTNAPLERFLAEALTTGGRTNDFRQLERELFVVAMNLDSADVTVFGKPDYDHVPISSAIQASTALPGLYTPVEIDGQYYIDGVARRTVHASVGLNAGADLLFCINPIVPINVQLEQHADRLLNDRRNGNERTVGNETSLADRGLPTVLSQTFRAIVDSRKRTGFKKYEHTHPEADLILIEPECDDTSLFFTNIFSFKNRHDVCEHAYQATRRHLRSRASELRPILERHDLSLRLDVLDDETRTLYETPLPKQPENQSDDEWSPSPSMTEVLNETRETLDRLDGLLDRLHAHTVSTSPSGNDHSQQHS
ncbi:MAG: patatin-like phospholipase family protein [Salinibacter sp.]